MRWVLVVLSGCDVLGGDPSYEPPAETPVAEAGQRLVLGRLDGVEHVIARVGVGGGGWDLATVPHTVEREPDGTVWLPAPYLLAGGAPLDGSLEIELLDTGAADAASGPVVGSLQVTITPPTPGDGTTLAEFATLYGSEEQASFIDSVLGGSWDSPLSSDALLDQALSVDGYLANLGANGLADLCADPESPSCSSLLVGGGNILHAAPSRRGGGYGETFMSSALALIVAEWPGASPHMLEAIYDEALDLVCQQAEGPDCDYIADIVEDYAFAELINEAYDIVLEAFFGLDPLSRLRALRGGIAPDPLTQAWEAFVPQIPSSAFPDWIEMMHWPEYVQPSGDPGFQNLYHVMAQEIIGAGLGVASVSAGNATDPRSFFTMIGKQEFSSDRPAMLRACSSRWSEERCIGAILMAYHAGAGGSVETPPAPGECTTVRTAPSALESGPFARLGVYEGECTYTRKGESEQQKFVLTLDTMGSGYVVIGGPCPTGILPASSLGGVITSGLPIEKRSCVTTRGAITCPNGNVIDVLGPTSVAVDVEANDIRFVCEAEWARWRKFTGK